MTDDKLKMKDKELVAPDLCVGRLFFCSIVASGLVPDELPLPSWEKF
jgi:hypothetical protein